MRGDPWTPEEDEIADQMRAARATNEEIGARLRRTATAVATRLSYRSRSRDNPRGRPGRPPKIEQERLRESYLERHAREVSSLRADDPGIVGYDQPLSVGRDRLLEQLRRCHRIEDVREYAP
jgi:hypothetical protein